ncbi:lipopolysaccharide biosynthesis protein [Mesorhizobium sp. NZP2077]|nr:lipopolysaccharide biosynthesis protein [Mesorhizobium sp. NZP2077]QKD19895.1 lipopolysaccharide biosynthesis protein [Mesorhizobium sp. NZP2077]
MDGKTYAHLSSRRSVAAMRGVFWSTINAVVPTLSSSIVFIISSRYLMPTDFGLVALAGSLAALASAFAPGAFGEALVQRSSLDKSHLDSVFWLCMVSAAILYALIIIFSGPIARFVDQPGIVGLLPLLGSRVLFDLGAAVPNALISRTMSFGLIAMRTTLAASLSGVVCVCMLVMGYGLWALAVSQLCLSIVSCVAAFWSAGWRPGIEIRAKSLLDVGRYGLFASGNRFLQLMSFDQIIIGALVGPAPLGVFNFAKRVFSILNDVIAGALGAVSHTLLSSLQNERDKLKDAFLLGTFASASVSFPAFVGLAAIAGDAIPLIFGSHWSEAIAPIQVFCSIGLLSCIGVLQSSLINSQGKTDWWFCYQLVAQMLNILLVIVFYRYGILAVVSAIAIKTFAIWPVSVAMTVKTLDIPATTYLRQFVSPTCAVALMLISVILVNRYLGDASFSIRAAGEVIVAGLVYSAALASMSHSRLRYVFSLIKSRGRS